MEGEGGGGDHMSIVSDRAEHVCSLAASTKRPCGAVLSLALLSVVPLEFLISIAYALAKHDKYRASALDPLIGLCPRVAAVLRVVSEAR